MCSGMHYAAHPGIQWGASGAGSVERTWQLPCGPTPLWYYCSELHLTAKRLIRPGGMTHTQTNTGITGANAQLAYSDLTRRLRLADLEPQPGPGLGLTGSESSWADSESGLVC